MTWLFFFLTASLAFAEKTELQWALCESNAELVLEKLGQENWEREDSSITYFESADPGYYREGVSFRVKQKRGEKKSVVKVRGDARTIDGDNCEWDRYGDQVAYACKLEAAARGAHVWTAAQRRFVERFTKVNWENLHAFGPYPVSAWEGKAKKEKLVLEAMRPDVRSPILELSTRVDAGEADEIYRKITHFLEENDVHLCRVQEGKALRLFRALRS